ncbi:30S ribosomal protein S4 [Halanaerobiaceae bacterium Z-7014]|uniref:Small ribosomal subunit protein uS4 n=1 Tax=Halonatronomonas betaini TaxID=2778430 RepID=A0A931FA54_9FIRM|nr:30S ribosomal protein S4 [Halonatronomonas betaini]MBF8436587.1 30S ribosomal protein S4 [Halonatronomonas betaini]
MATRRNPRFKEARRLGLNVHGHPKAMERADGTFNRKNRNLSNYGEQLIEKQRLRAYYGLLEKQFSKYVENAMKEPGITGNNLIRNLEMRLDNLVYRIGFARSIRQARQMVSHGLIRVDGEKVDWPSYKIEPGMEISLRSDQRKNDHFRENYQDRTLEKLSYITRDIDNFSAIINGEPEIKEIPIVIDVQLVVEYYAK